VATAWAYLDNSGPIPFAHRGGASEHPENTLAAFQSAVDLGYRYLETDVHVTADGVLLAFHDETLDRVTDRQGRIRDLPWSVVREARVDGQEPIPLLEEILGEWPEARVNIDVKHETSVEPLVETLRRTNSFDRVCVAAFSDGRLSRVRRLTGLRVCTALGPREIGQLRIASFGWPAARSAVPVSRFRLVSADAPSSTGGSSTPPIAAGSTSTSGRSTTPPRWSGCSIWASTAS